MQRQHLSRQECSYCEIFTCGIAYFWENARDVGNRPEKRPSRCLEYSLAARIRADGRLDRWPAASLPARERCRPVSRPGPGAGREGGKWCGISRNKSPAGNRASRVPRAIAWAIESEAPVRASPCSSSAPKLGLAFWTSRRRGACLPEGIAMALGSRHEPEAGGRSDGIRSRACRKGCFPRTHGPRRPRRAAESSRSAPRHRECGA